MSDDEMSSSIAAPSIATASKLGETGPEQPRCWLAAYTRSRHEQQVAKQLQQKQLSYLLPTYERLARWSDRVVRSEAPLFPGYLFVHVSDRERAPVLQTAGVVRLVSRAGKAVVLLQEEVERLRTCISHPGCIEPHPYLRIGHRVRVKYGPFAGWEGTLLEKQNSRRLIVTIEGIMKAVAVTLDGVDVEAVK